MKKIETYSPTTVGSKAYNLSIMRQSGLSVPAFSAYAYDCFDNVANQEELSAFQARYDQKQLSLSELSLALIRWGKVKFEKENVTAVSELTASSQTFSVRSSATVEDGADASFAGQFLSKLHVSAPDLPQALEAVFLSLFEESALAYFFQQGLRLEQFRMIALVQEMVVGDVSGVYFTANPKGILNEHIIILGEGDGSGIVEDRVPTSMTTYHPADDLSYVEQAEGAPVLSSRQLEELTKATREVTNLFGPYLDIEFTFVADKLYLLQARPITTLDNGQQTILDNSNIVESYPGLSTPLTISFVKAAYTHIFRGLASRLLKGNQADLAAYEPTFQTMVTASNHRLYYQIDAWYQLLQLLPFSNKIIPIWQDMLGVRDTRVPAMPVHLSRWRRWQTTWQIVKTFRTTPRQMAELETDFQAVQATFDREFSPTADPKDLQALFETIKNGILAKWDITLMNDLYAFVYTGWLKKLQKADHVQATIAGIEQIESMKPARALQSCLDLLRENPDDLKTLAEQGDFATFLQTNHPLALALRDFIEQYGDRAPEELKLETETYRTHPERLRQLLLEQAKQPAPKVSKPEKAEKTLSFLQDWVQKRAKRGIQYRESSRLNRTRIYGMMRQIFRALGQQMANASRLEKADDVFFLDMDEVFAYSQAEAVNVPSLHQLINTRRQTFERDQNLPTFSRLVYAGPVFDKTPSLVTQTQQPDASQTEFRGIGCSKGKVRGQVLVVENVQTVEVANDRIIVTKMTDPGWVYLLTQAKGIIAEQGSLLSHTAIISRELGIPSVVGVKSATHIFKTGEWIEMDGLTGDIRRLEKTDDRD